jgi:branched-chain amino acid transport system ATP-binding protein
MSPIDSAAPPALELKGISAAYDRSMILRDIDLRLEAGTIAALLGPNGAGKTTLLRVASGLLSPTQGTVVIDGTDATRLSPSRRAQLGLCLIPEGRGVFAGLSVAENLRLQIPPWSKEKGYDRALEAFPALKDRLRAQAGRLSGGQQRMVALSRCFLAEPTVVLLDEISMGLAPKVVDEIYDALGVLVGMGMTILVVEQFVGKALSLASSVHLIGRGELNYSGPAEGLDEEAMVQGYLGHSNGDGAVAAPAATVSVDPNEKGSGDVGKA